MIEISEVFFFVFFSDEIFAVPEEDDGDGDCDAEMEKEKVVALGNEILNKDAKKAGINPILTYTTLSCKLSPMNSPMTCLIWCSGGGEDLHSMDSRVLSLGCECREHDLSKRKA